MHSVDMAVDVVELNKALTGSFIKLAKLLRKLHDCIHDSGDPGACEIFEAILKKADIRRRKAYYLIDVDRVFGDLDLPQKRLAAIGWTKLAVISPYVTSASLDNLLDLAAANTVESLKAELGSGKIEPATKFLTFRLGNQQYASVLGVLLAFGAKITKGSGLGGKEAALVKLCGLSLSVKHSKANAIAHE